MSVEYGNNLQGNLLTVVHDVCEHERVYGGEWASSLQWRADDISLNPAFVNSASVGPNFRILSAVLEIEGGTMDLKVHNTSTRDIEDDDWYAEDFLQAFKWYMTRHMKSEHELCLKALELKRNPPDKLYARRSATTGELIY